MAATDAYVRAMMAEYTGPLPKHHVAEPVVLNKGKKQQQQSNAKQQNSFQKNSENATTFTSTSSSISALPPITPTVIPRAFIPATPLPAPDYESLQNVKMNGRLGAGEGDWFSVAPSSASFFSSSSSSDVIADGGTTKRKRDTKNTNAVELADAGTMVRLRQIGQRLLDAEVEAAEAKGTVGRGLGGGGASGDMQWMRTVLRSGTSSDKLAALTLLIQQSPIHSLKHIDSILHIAAKKSRREASQAIEALRDLFITNLLPPDRKLSAFGGHSAAVAASLRAHYQQQNDHEQGSMSSLIPGKHGAKGKNGAGQPASAGTNSTTTTTSTKGSTVPRLRAETLALWVFEDELKQRYAEFARVLQSHLADGISHFKLSTLRAVTELLTERPEAEALLLSILVNKLGDPEGQVASRAQYHLSQLVERHEAMKPVVVREVRQFLYQPSLSPGAQYFAVLFLNQLTLHRKLPELALDLITTYFALFETCVQRNQLGSRLLSALLTGVNRAFPFTAGLGGSGAGAGAGPGTASEDRGLVAVEARSDVLFTVLHRGTPNTAVQALVMLQNVAQRRMAYSGSSSSGTTSSGALSDHEGSENDDDDDTSEDDGAASKKNRNKNKNKNQQRQQAAVSSPVTGDAFVDRFYRALYSKLTVEDIAATNKHALLLNTVFKSIKYDPHPARARAVLKRLVQVAASSSPQFAAGVIILVSELLRLRSELRGLVSTSEAPSTGSSSSSPSSKGISSTNIDESSDSDASEGSVELSLTKEQRSSKLALLDAALSKKESTVSNHNKTTSSSSSSSTAAPSPAPNAGSYSIVAAAATSTTPIIYDPFKREPKYAGADVSCLWELAPLAAHYHPSVRKFADSIMSNPHESIDYSGDPLTDFSLMAFLDRYVYKNPKKRNLEAFGKDAIKARAAAQKAAAAAGGEVGVDAELAAGYAILQGKDPVEAAALADGLVHGASRMQKRASRHGRVDIDAPASSSEFAAVDPENVREDDRFLHAFFRARTVQQGAAVIEQKKKDQKNLLSKKQSESTDLGSGDEEDEDEELEAFAQKVAEGLMQDAKDPDDDEEEEEEDMGEDEDGEEDKDAEDYSKYDFGAGLDEGSDDENDGDSGDDNDEDEDEDSRPPQGKRQKTSSFAEAPEDDEDEEEEDDEDDEDGKNAPKQSGRFDDVDEDDDDDYVWDEESSDDEASGMNRHGESKKGDGRKASAANTSSFASADDYVDLLYTDDEASDNDDDDDDDSKGNSKEKAVIQQPPKKSNVGIENKQQSSYSGSNGNSSRPPSQNSGGAAPRSSGDGFHGRGGSSGGGFSRGRGGSSGGDGFSRGRGGSSGGGGFTRGRGGSSSGGGGFSRGRGSSSGGGGFSRGRGGGGEGGFRGRGGGGRGGGGGSRGFSRGRGGGGGGRGGGFQRG